MHRREVQGDDGPAAFLAESGRISDFPKDRVPDLRPFPDDAEGAVRGERIAFPVGNEIYIGFLGCAMDEVQTGRFGADGRRFEIRRYAVSRQDLARGSAPDHPALAVAMFGAGFSIAVPPNLIGDGADFVVAARIVLQSGRLLRFGPDDRCAGADEIANLTDRFERHRPGGNGRYGQGKRAADHLGHFRGSSRAILQDEEPVAQAVGKNDPAAFDRHAGQEGFGVGIVEIIAGAERRVLGFGRGDNRRPVAEVITNIAGEDSLLEHILAARKVGEEGRRLLPPSAVGVPMLAGAEFIAGLAVRRRLAGGLVQHDGVDPFAEGGVDVGLEVGRRQRPVRSIALLLGERLGHGLGLAVNMSGRGGLLEIKSHIRIRVVTAGEIEMSVDPEFAGRQIAAALVFQRIHGREIARAGRLAAHADSPLVAELSEMAIEIFGQTILYSAVEILLEPRREFGVDDDAAGERR